MKWRTITQAVDPLTGEVWNKCPYSHIMTNKKTITYQTNEEKTLTIKTITYHVERKKQLELKF